MTVTDFAPFFAALFSVLLITRLALPLIERVWVCLRAMKGVKDPELFMEDVWHVVDSFNRPVYTMVPTMKRLTNIRLEIIEKRTNYEKTATQKT